MSDELTYAATLTVYAKNEEETVELTQKMGAIMVGHIRGSRDCSLFVSAFTPDGEMVAEEELEL